MRSSLPLFSTALALLMACEPTQPPVTPSPTGSASSASSAPPAPTDHERAGFPVIVTLSALGTNAATGETELQVTLDVNRPPGYPLTLTVTVPSGVQLASGQPQESITITQPGQLQRRFRVVGSLSPQAPFRVVVHGQAPDRSSGIHADQKYPLAAPSAPASTPPPPPGGRPPVVPPRR